MDEINDRIEELTNVVDSTKDQLITELKVFQELYPDYSYIVQREKLVYETLNKFDEDSTRRCLVGEGWIPSVDFEKIRGALRKLINEKTRRDRRSSAQSNDSLDISVDAETDTFVIDESDHDISGIELDDSSEEAGSLIAVVNKLTTNRTLLRITKQTSLPPHFN